MLSYRLRTISGLLSLGWLWVIHVLISCTAWGVRFLCALTRDGLFFVISFVFLIPFVIVMTPTLVPACISCSCSCSEECVSSSVSGCIHCFNSHGRSWNCSYKGPSPTDEDHSIYVHLALWAVWVTLTCCWAYMTREGERERQRSGSGSGTRSTSNLLCVPWR